MNNDEYVCLVSKRLIYVIDKLNFFFQILDGNVGFMFKRQIVLNIWSIYQYTIFKIYLEYSCKI